MTFPFLAGTRPNFLNFGKVTRGKKETLILEIWNGRIRKTGVWVCCFVFFFFQRSKREEWKEKSMNKHVERTWMDENEGGCAERPRF